MQYLQVIKFGKNRKIIDQVIANIEVISITPHYARSFFFTIQYMKT